MERLSAYSRGRGWQTTRLPPRSRPGGGHVRLLPGHAHISRLRPAFPLIHKPPPPPPASASGCSPTSSTLLALPNIHTMPDGVVGQLVWHPTRPPDLSLSSSGTVRARPSHRLCLSGLELLRSSTCLPRAQPASSLPLLVLPSWPSLVSLERSRTSDAITSRMVPRVVNSR